MFRLKMLSTNSLPTKFDFVQRTFGQFFRVRRRWARAVSAKARLARFVLRVLKVLIKVFRRAGKKILTLLLLLMGSGRNRADGITLDGVGPKEWEEHFERNCQNVAGAAAGASAVILGTTCAALGHFRNVFRNVPPTPTPSTLIPCGLTQSGFAALFSQISGTRDRGQRLEVEPTITMAGQYARSASPRPFVGSMKAQHFLPPPKALPVDDLSLAMNVFNTLTNTGLQTLVQNPTKKVTLSAGHAHFHTAMDHLHGVLGKNAY